MATFRHGTTESNLTGVDPTDANLTGADLTGVDLADPDPTGAVRARRFRGQRLRARRSPAPARLAALVAGLAMVGLLSACGSDSSASGTAQTLPGTADPVSGDRTTAAGASTAASPSDDATDAPATPASGTSTSASSAPSTSGGGASSTRCHTSELSASIGRNDPGAGQENFPVNLTNTSQRTCTLRGFPGAAFVDASGKQLGADPERSSESPTTVKLAPGKQAWAGLTFSNPEISGARTATPAALLVTPPDEKDSLKVKWTQGKVPVSGNSSRSSLTVLRPGTGS
ncbi:DUF4232 domain-containing protein [Streptomyces sp. NPDC088747]|uniref:DUF4232 domain-containing protein n=1 Tax=Streptomyces sp. NPDC088747 TaxID=3365886 RepID=UPI003821513A